MHADQQAARVRRLVALLDSKTGEVSKPRPRAVGARQMALLELETLVRPHTVGSYVRLHGRRWERWWRACASLAT